MSAYAISHASKSNIPQLVSLVNSAYRGEAARQGWTHEADLIDGDSRTNEDDLSKLLDDPQAVILVCSDKTGLAGSVYLKKDGEELYLGMLSVHPRMQGKGIGKLLLRAAETHAKERRCTAIKMTVISVRTELIAWYGKNGYQSTGHREPFPIGNEFGTPRQPLEFVVLKKVL
jgi:ribosomal protein S18 acetylase RimI-like enzyme